ncbi:MAG: tetraacyldisaccharide 4'-kinase [Candidatus Omnitrophica bacterium]|nr:tetraacyldisaccharide 4'-kinase [Candidatus Omnitrophota bacterium]
MHLREHLYNLATDKTQGLPSALIKFPLYLLSLVYGLLVLILSSWNGLRKIRLGCKVISVGNITVGGTGKTVMVERIAGYLQENGHKVAVLSRGYKRPGSKAIKSAPGYETMGDEPFMISQKFPDVLVLVDPDRVRSARSAIAVHGVDTVILDDGFQQWKVKKDLEIVMLDGKNPFGNRRLLPRGILRQPLFTLKNADVFVLTNTGKAQLSKTRELLLRMNSRAIVLEAEHSVNGLSRLSRKEERLSADYLTGQKVALFCGLGNSDSFRNLAGKLGLKEELFFEFPDHYRYQEEDIEKIVNQSRQKGFIALVTTEKDAVRIPLAARKRFGENIFVLAVELKFKDEEQRFFDRLLNIYFV